MRDVIQAISWTLGLALNILVLVEMAKGHYRRFPILFLYCVALALSTVFEIAVRAFPELDRAAPNYYWIDDSLRQALLFAVVIFLIHGSMERAGRHAAVLWLLLGALSISAISVAAHYDAEMKVDRWMTAVGRDLSFASAILDLVLWFVLVASRKRDPVLFLLSGGLGLQFAGQAAGHSLRQLAARPQSQVLKWTGNIFLLLANLACLYLWWRTFRRTNANAAGTPTDA